MELPYEKIIPRAERENLESALGMESGYVLDFSDRTFDDFFYETVGIDPQEQSDLFKGRGTSKAKRLRAFIEQGNPAKIAKVLRELWEYRDRLNMPSQNEEKTREVYFNTVARIEDRSV